MSWVGLAVADGTPGFWSASGEVFPDTRRQRCWVHMMANILDKLPQTQQQQARADLHRIYYAATKAEAISRVVYFSERYRAHPSAVRCLLEDQNDLLTFFDFPKAHWRQRRLPESGVLTESRSSPRDHSDTAQFLLHNI